MSQKYCRWPSEFPGNFEQDLSSVLRISPVTITDILDYICEVWDHWRLYYHTDHLTIANSTTRFFTTTNNIQN
ncbi:unnamed protein product [Allacma fusca]|uniref:Uncharacterized protein n=1 Tax=Allacma fusca TaxID=39272 RepID=A0A8J2KHQ5_9HEXA|nr:unnamed protein product [Allacma fusca]